LRYDELPRTCGPWIIDAMFLVRYYGLLIQRPPQAYARSIAQDILLYHQLHPVSGIADCDDR